MDTVLGGTKRIVAALGFLVFLGNVPPDAPLADAAMDGDRAAIEALLERGADVNEAQGDGMTALHWAADHGDAEMADLLIQAGANLDAVTRLGGYTPLLIAAEEGRIDVLLALLEAGADPHARRDRSGTTALHFAAEVGSEEAIDALVRAGADVDVLEDEWGQTPLMFAASNNRTAALRSLLGHGADVSITTKVLPIPDRAAQTETERSQHFFEGASLRVEHDAGAQVDNADASL